jgi:hypothetical protein
MCLDQSLAVTPRICHAGRMHAAAVPDAGARVGGSRGRLFMCLGSSSCAPLSSHAREFLCFVPRKIL